MRKTCVKHASQKFATKIKTCVKNKTCVKHASKIKTYVNSPFSHQRQTIFVLAYLISPSDPQRPTDSLPRASLSFLHVFSLTTPIFCSDQ